jgi:hypothetical protein
MRGGITKLKGHGDRLRPITLDCFSLNIIHFSRADEVTNCMNFAMVDQEHGHSSTK